MKKRKKERRLLTYVYLHHFVVLSNLIPGCLLGDIAGQMLTTGPYNLAIFSLSLF